MLGGTQIFHDVRCQNCGLIYLNPRPSVDEIAQYYPAEYEPFNRHENLQSLPARISYRISFSKRRRIASHGMAPGRLLDVGSGSGDFLLEMRNAGWDVYGVDISPAACEATRKRGLETYNGQLFDVPFPDESFDLITMWDVLEHVHDPMGHLEHISRLLKPSGRFVVTLPNPEGLDLVVFKDLWAGLDFPRHLYVYPRKTLKAMISKAGMEVTSARCVTGGARASIWSIEFVIDDKVKHPGARRLLKRIIYSPVWYFSWRPFYFLLDKLNAGSSITFTCRKG
ncbi:MAG: class I SAM-dependent methyltransferase [Anaerolineales bacterium]|nr:class I SAM-dependent methyltransferase [Anaerolineales bacterium]